MRVDTMIVLGPADQIRNSSPQPPGTFGRRSCGAVKMNRFWRSAYRHPFAAVPTSLSRRIWAVGDHVPCPIIHLSMPRSAETMEVSDAIRT
jgi:hypothetical protein